MKPPAYFDNASTYHPKPREVGEAITHYLSTIGASPGRGGHTFARRAEAVVESTREKLARILGVARHRHVAFTPNATHALNFAISGLLKPGDHVITTIFEHNSVLRPLAALERAGRITTTYLDIDPAGDLDLDSLALAIRPDTKAIVCTHASNVIGNILPLEKIARLARSRGIAIIVDVAQTAGLIPFHLDDWEIDIACGAGHKGLMGPSGVGFIYVRDPDRLDPMVVGGSGHASMSPFHPGTMPEMFEAGTTNYLGIAGLGAACDLILDHTAHTSRLRNKHARFHELIHALADNDDIILYGHQDLTRKVPIVSFNLRDLSPAHTGCLLDEKFGIMVRAGLQCAPRLHKRLGTAPEGTVRASLGYTTTPAEIQHLAASLRELRVLN